MILNCFKYNLSSNCTLSLQIHDYYAKGYIKYKSQSPPRYDEKFMIINWSFWTLKNIMWGKFWSKSYCKEKTNSISKKMFFIRHVVHKETSVPSQYITISIQLYEYWNSYLKWKQKEVAVMCLLSSLVWSFLLNISYSIQMVTQLL